MPSPPRAAATPGAGGNMSPLALPPAAAPRDVELGSTPSPRLRQSERRGRGFFSPKGSPAGSRPRQSPTPSKDGDGSPELRVLPGVSRRNLQRQKRVRVVELRADGSSKELWLRMREVQALIQDAVPRPRRREAVPDGRRSHNALHPRDLRAIDASNPHACKNPSVVVRQHVVVCNLPPLRCVVVWDRLLALLPGDDERLGDELARQLAERLFDAAKKGADPDADSDERADAESPAPAPRNDSTGSLPDLDDDERLPFELRALEAVLQTCTARLDEACEAVEAPAEASMREMQTARTYALDNLERLRHVKNGVSHLEARARDTAEALEALLDEDEDMCMMRLSLLRERPTLFDPPIPAELLTQHEDVELLLESYLHETEAVQTRLELVRLRIDNAEDLFTMKLDLARNRLITADTIFTLLSMSMAAGAVVGGLFGMNLDQERRSFLAVSVATAAAVTLGTGLIVAYLVRSNTLVLG